MIYSGKGKGDLISAQASFLFSGSLVAAGSLLRSNHTPSPHSLSARGVIRLSLPWVSLTHTYTHYTHMKTFLLDCWRLEIWFKEGSSHWNHIFHSEHGGNKQRNDCPGRHKAMTAFTSQRPFSTSTQTPEKKERLRGPKHDHGLRLKCKGVIAL